MAQTNYLDTGTSSRPEDVDEATLGRILGEGITRLSPEAKSIILSALQKARERKVGYSIGSVLTELGK